MCCTERQGDIDGGIRCDDRLTERYIESDWRNNQTATDTLDLAILAVTSLGSLVVSTVRGDGIHYI